MRRMSFDRQSESARSSIGSSAIASGTSRRCQFGGNQAHLRRLAVGGQPLQAKLRVGAVNDPLEREADAAADQVMRMAEPRISLSSPPRLSRQCEECEEREDDEPKSKRKVPIEDGARSGFVKVNQPNAGNTGTVKNDPAKAESKAGVDPNLLFLPVKYVAQRDETELAKSINVPKDKPAAAKVAVKASGPADEKAKLGAVTTANVTPQQGKAFEGGSYKSLPETFTKTLDAVSLTAEATEFGLEAYPNQSKMLYVGEFNGRLRMTVGEAAEGMKVFNEGLGKFGTAVGAYQWITAETDKEARDAAADLAIDAALYLTRAPTPVSIGVGLAQLLTSTDLWNQRMFEEFHREYQWAVEQGDSKKADIMAKLMNERWQLLHPELVRQPGEPVKASFNQGKQ